MGKIALMAPSGIRTVAGTVIMVRRFAITVTTAPPKGAGPVRTIVPFAGVPPITRDGVTVKEASVTAFSGATMTAVLWRTPP
ncbi:MAG: hypothetical protein ACYC9N_22760 [Thermoanaerobaculia bacterium]